MITRTARLASTITIAMLACSGCERRSPNPPDSGRRTQANVPLFATLYVDDHDVCSQAAYPEKGRLSGIEKARRASALSGSVYG